MSSSPRTLISTTPTHLNSIVTIQGWVDAKRDHGQLTFLDIRDHTGIIQCVAHDALKKVSLESVVEVTGKVVNRPAAMVNKKIPTGEIELEVTDHKILNVATELPIPINTDGKEINEETRLKYRYLDLRRPRLQKIIKLRSQLINSLRAQLTKQDFLEVETPMLTKSTKEGARDFVVPSRFYPGKFYALPQSPQQYKQLLMTAGVPRYFQFARCIRDEDLRSDRGFEFTQLDLEMSFVSQIEEVMSVVEAIVKTAVQENGSRLVTEKFPVINYPDAMQKYGADKFDLRTPEQKEAGQLAFAWVVNFPFFKKVDKQDAAEVRDGKSGYTFTHNPFSAPLPEFLPDHLAQKNIDGILTAQYDLVCNGYEVGGGSLRAHQPEVLKSTFKIMGYTDLQIEQSIGHMLKAFQTGTPPHGGIALGVDRLVMLMANEESLKEVLAFPMTSSGHTAVMEAPSEISEEQAAELGLSATATAGTTPHDALITKLQSHGVSYQYLSHAPVFTSAEAAQVRGTKLAQSAKALVLEADKQYILLVLPGDQQANLEKLQQVLKVKKLRMASKDSVTAKTKLEVGSIPPFGSVLGLPTYLDNRMSQESIIAFNCGRHDRSVTMSYDDYIRLEKPQLVDLT